MVNFANPNVLIDPKLKLHSVCHRRYETDRSKGGEGVAKVERAESIKSDISSESQVKKS